MVTFLGYMLMCAGLCLLGVTFWHCLSWNKGKCRRCGAQLKVYYRGDPIKHGGYHNAECPQCGARFFVDPWLVKHPADLVVFAGSSVLYSSPSKKTATLVVADEFEALT